MIEDPGVTSSPPVATVTIRKDDYERLMDRIADKLNKERMVYDRLAARVLFRCAATTGDGQDPEEALERFATEAEVLRAESRDLKAAVRLLVSRICPDSMVGVIAPPNEWNQGIDIVARVLPDLIRDRQPKGD